MANLFDISKALVAAWDAAINPETGELDEALLADFEALQMERDTKIENIGCWIKNLEADAAAIKAEAKAMSDRAKAAEKKAEGLRGYLAAVLAGEKWSSPKVAISWRKSVAVEIDEAEVPELPEQYVRRKVSVEADKTAIKEALKAGESIEGCRLVERQNISIK